CRRRIGHPSDARPDGRGRGRADALRDGRPDAAATPGRGTPVTELAEIESEQAGNAWLVRVRGEIDMTNTIALSASIERGMPSGASRLVLDLSSTTYVDSAGVALLLRLAERLRNRRQELRLVVAPASSVRAVLDLSGVAGAMRVESALPDALADHAPAS